MTKIMKKKQFFVLLLVTVFVSASAMASLTNVGAKSMDLPVPLSTEDVIGVTPEMMGKYEGEIHKLAAEEGSAATGSLSIGDPVEEGDVVSSVVSDWVYGPYEEDFRVILKGEHGIILITEDAYQNYDVVTDEYVFTNPEWENGGGWNPEDRISTAQLVYMLDEFDNNIFPTVTGVFGELLPRGDEGTKVWVLIHNIQDEAFYDGEETSYVAGYFSSGENAYHDRNMFHIDTHEWNERVGPDGARPHLYEGTFAHEFEHMCHYDIDADEPSWVDEGLADLASYLCGYGHSSGHIAYYFVYHETTPLTFWGGGLPDYGASYLFQLYLWEHFGGTEFISALVEEQANGIKGIENTLTAFGYTETFDEIFDAWTIANYIDDTRKSGGKYGYSTLELGTIDTWGYSIEWSVSTFFGPPLDFPFYLESSWYYGDAMPYTAHYFRFTNDRAADVIFDGGDYAGTTAYSGTYEWYSGMGAWAWGSFSQTFDIPVGGATLNFMTYFEIEGHWDYGYVEVHDLDTDEWYTLPSNETVNILVYSQDNPNTPIEREPSTYAAAGRFNGLTGSSNGWIPISMDLTPFAGHAIELFFTSWQDGAYTEEMMYVDDISIPEIEFYDGAEAGEGDWTPAGWYVTDGMLANGWGVSIIDTKGVPTARYPDPTGNNAMTLHSHGTLYIDPTYQFGMGKVSATTGKSGRVNVAILSNRADH
ncbi:MAG: hypothetical protein ACTSRE_17280, partial [Promethearchaeota archaeon]